MTSFREAVEKSLEKYPGRGFENLRFYQYFPAGCLRYLKILKKKFFENMKKVLDISDRMQ